MTDRPDEHHDDGLQHERTALAWERTAISLMVAGIVFARFTALDAHWAVALLGLALTAFGGGVLIWSSLHYEDLHAPLRAGAPVVHPCAVRIIGAVTVSSAGLALVVALVVALSTW